MDSFRAYLQNNSDSFSHLCFRANWYIDFPPNQDDPLTPQNCHAETTTLKQVYLLYPHWSRNSTEPSESTNNTLIPLSSGQITATFSHLSAHVAHEAIFILRCQNCEVVTNYFASDPEVELTTVVSTSLPVFIDGNLANLSFTGAELDLFMLNTNQAQFANYSAMLSAAGLA